MPQGKLNRVPRATYRFQFNADFTLRQARELLPYLKELGISDVYASPLFQAGPQSTHGYDICGYNKINPNLGTLEDFKTFSREVRNAGMGLLLDMVPNHMGSHRSNDWWRDVLQYGRKSKFAHFFDINWHSRNPLLAGKVLLPVLGDRYAVVLEKGELQLNHEEGEYRLAYYENWFPLSPESIDFIRKEYGDQPKKALARLNGSPGEPRSWDALDQVLQLQHYRLGYWRVAAEEINYRRFFDVTELVSVRVEDLEVFNATHELTLQLVNSGAVTGLRIDHPDGLRDPKKYFERLQENFEGDQKLYVVAEKILSGEERLPSGWPVAGTTGYEYLNRLNGVFVDRGNAGEFDRVYQNFTKRSADFQSLVYECKKSILEKSLISETASLLERLQRLAAQSRYGRDFTSSELHYAIVNFIAAFPVYRTYVTEETVELSSVEIEQVEQAFAEAKERSPESMHAVLEFTADILRLKMFADFPAETDREAREFVIRFQQVSGPATAKGLEDTAFYRFHRLISLNEVGGEPGKFGTTPEEFHEFNTYTAAHYPHTLLATATHDTKRGEDFRARVNVLSEVPESWGREVKRWAEINSSHKGNASGFKAPTANDEYLLYQTLVGSWTGEANDEFIERIQQYMLKALREAKMETAWTAQNPEYEKAVTDFVAAILRSREFLNAFVPFQETVSAFGFFNSLSQVLLKICSPGVPDFYQGAELWDFNLVDPDNRRPVDYQNRQRLLHRAAADPAAGLLNERESGAAKLLATHRALAFRREHPELFEAGSYTPLKATGPAADHVIAFERTAGNARVVAVAPRLVARLCGFKPPASLQAVFEGTSFSLPAGTCRNVLTGTTHSCDPSLSIARVLGEFPVALLEVLH